MKKLIIIFLFLGTVLLGEDLTFSGEVIESLYYNDELNDWSPMPIYVYYAIESKVPTIIVEGVISEYRIPLSEKQMVAVSNLIAKYLEWEQVAVENSVTVKKEIGKIQINLQWEWEYDWYFGEASDLIFVLSSFDVEQHFLSIAFTKTKSTTNEYAEFKPQELLLDKEQAIKLQAQLTVTAAEAAIAKFREKTIEVDSLFQ